MQLRGGPQPRRIDFNNPDSLSEGPGAARPQPPPPATADGPRPAPTSPAGGQHILPVTGELTSTSLFHPPRTLVAEPAARPQAQQGAAARPLAPPPPVLQAGLNIAPRPQQLPRKLPTAPRPGPQPQPPQQLQPQPLQLQAQPPQSSQQPPSQPPQQQQQQARCESDDAERCNSDPTSSVVSLLPSVPSDNELDAEMHARCRELARANARAQEALDAAERNMSRAKLRLQELAVRQTLLRIGVAAASGPAANADYFAQAARCGALLGGCIAGPQQAGCTAGPAA